MDDRVIPFGSRFGTQNFFHKILHLPFQQEIYERAVIFVSHEWFLGHFPFCQKQGLNFPKRTCEANPESENSLFIFTFKSVPLYHFKLAYVVLHLTVKEYFETSL